MPTSVSIDAHIGVHRPGAPATARAAGAAAGSGALGGCGRATGATGPAEGTCRCHWNRPDELRLRKESERQVRRVSGGLFKSGFLLA